LTSGAYSFLLTVTYSSGQQATGTVNVTINQIVTANAGRDTALTGGTTTTTLTGSGTGTGIDTFKLTVTDNIGTMAFDTVIITINPLPTANAGTNQTLYQGTTSTTLS